MEDLQLLLKHEGLSQKEIDIYLRLLQIGKAPVSTIARLTAINRTQTYQILEKLRGNFVNPEMRNGITYYLPVDPQIIVENIKHNKKSLLSIAEQVSAKLIHYKPPDLANKDGPTIQIYQGINEITTMLESHLQNENSELAGIIDQSFYDLLYYIKTKNKLSLTESCQQKQIKIKGIYTVPRPTLKHLHRDRLTQRESKIISPAFDTGLSLLISSEKFTLISASQQIAICITNHALRKSILNLFNLGWRFSKKITP